MALSGDLEHLSIVDVIQLLHTSRKTGTLKVQGRKGEISIAFHDGYIVGANHYSRGALIGTILVEAKVISADALQKALVIQERSGELRKPLIATLLENNLADRNAAFRGLEALIELAIVEILTWKKGHFALHVNEMLICDEFRYFPEKLDEELTLPTEHVLMDALRIFDEKMRDGLIEMEDENDEEPGKADEGILLSADDLGLGDLDSVERRLPSFHEAIPDRQANNTVYDSIASSDRFGELMRRATGRLGKASTLPETALVLLETVAAIFPRTLTLVVRDRELVAERSIGITAPREAGPGAVMGFKVPLLPDSVFSFILDKGLLFYGKSNDRCLYEQLYTVISAPDDPTILILPLKFGKRVVSICYADFGNQAAVTVPTSMLGECAEYAGAAIESNMLHKKIH